MHLPLLSVRGSRLRVRLPCQVLELGGLIRREIGEVTSPNSFAVAGGSRRRLVEDRGVHQAGDVVVAGLIQVNVVGHGEPDALAQPRQASGFKFIVESGHGDMPGNEADRAARGRPRVARCFFGHFGEELAIG